MCVDVLFLTLKQEKLMKLKYVDTLIGFQEIPDEISLCINISNCPNNCPGCHSPYLAQNIGTELTDSELLRLIEANKGISCVCLMGGDSNPEEINDLAKIIKSKDLKVGWYSGKDILPWEIQLRYFDYVKLGAYIEELGPLNSPTTNQIMFKIDHFSDRADVSDITSRFWKDGQH